MQWNAYFQPAGTGSFGWFETVSPAGEETFHSKVPTTAVGAGSSESSVSFPGVAESAFHSSVRPVRAGRFSAHPFVPSPLAGAGAFQWEVGFGLASPRRFEDIVRRDAQNGR